MQKGASSGLLDRAPGRDFPVAITTTPATSEQRRIAIGTIVVLIVIAVTIAPFADAQLPRIDVFVPVLQTVLAVADLITALLLFAQYAILPHRATLAVASAYLCSACFAFLQTLTFPGAYAPAGLFGDGPNSPAWFFVLWHVTFPLGILIYALVKDTDEPTHSRRSVATSIVFTVLCVTGVVIGLSWLVTARVENLPVFYESSVVRQTSLGNQANVALLLWYGITLVVLWLRQRTILDIWLIVILVAWMPNFVVAALASSVRFSLGWYAGRGFALVASFLLLSVLLTEMTILYSRLARAFSLLRRERANRLMSVDAATAAIAHEVRSPLAAISLNASTALVQLRSNPPVLNEMGDILVDIQNDSLRASEVISGVRTLFKSAPSEHTPARLEDIVRRALTLLESDFLTNHVSVTADFPHRNEVHADPVQLQQVVMNLIRNSIEAMDSLPVNARRLMIASMTSEDSVVLSIQDTGSGVPSDARDRIFDAFFTTKPSGTGLGLAICRTIVESHGGQLRLAASGPEGSIFEIALPRR